MARKPIQEGRRPSTGAGSRIYSRENVGRYSERARQRRRGRVIRNAVLCALAAMVFAGAAFGLAFVNQISSNLRGSSITDDLLAELKDSDVTREPFYMLLLGTDGRKGETNFRSDTIVVARVDASKKQVTLISIPRDTKVEVDGQVMKINATHFYGGADDVVKAVNNLLWPDGSEKISHYAEVNFNGMKDLVDAIGGVEVNVPDRIDDEKAGKDVVIEPGKQVLNGKEALAFCRSRKFADGDYTRMRHQRIFIAALAKQVLNNTNATNILPLIQSVSSMIETDMTLESIAALANAMRGMDTDEIWSANLPSWAGEDTYIDGQNYVFVDEEALAAMMERVDAGEDPKAPQTMSYGGTESDSSTVGDLTNNSADDWSNGTATSDNSATKSSSSDEEGSSDSSSEE